jgi:pyruvate-ferredoxin/flavodoxin oxidoreductase
VDLSNNLRQQDLAVKSGHWPLLRYDPREREQGRNPLRLDSPEPSIPFKDFASTETRFTMLARSHPEEAAAFIKAAEEEARLRYAEYKELSELPLPGTERTEKKHD